MRFRTIQAGPLMQMPVFLILFFAPVYVPLNLLSGLDPRRRDVNPLTYVLETGRGFVAGDAPHVAGAFAIAIGLGLLVLGLGVPRPAERGGRGRLGALGVQHAQQRVDDLRVELRARRPRRAAASPRPRRATCGTGGRSSSRGRRRTRGRSATRAGSARPTGGPG